MELDAAKWDTTYQDGALSRKTKRLMALAIGLRAGCENCIIAQTMHAIDAGATRAEIMETISVNMAMSGTTGVGEGLKVIQLLDELGL
ncbi:carboxymuconolactone decarboxylase family protein [Desulfobulbus marinus]|nr:carboxymuconolactone decarboxylase family protein [Desulfogranum marinum]